ncbi:DNA-binding domain-containing protein, AraC-type [Aequorivita sublithincola DSM 14238]|uniref:DNA-binding domain-containing protein, AraC-type n=1 Tax=Aequorivita sublithincola (strain DSM 14238 / LMG 21431 / ACAM 643 / 9-3) TaxID=746697 RepID=I3YS97_AEQSU|nr:helix-turn-helix domain-containing protein [Aequorivita sublithincola]AFL79865.1 DNA-binding domain-containing protein, AraC-type [Aequorivita sublithincola DSM 14238]
MEVNALTITAIVSCVISVLLAVFLLSVKSKNSISNKLFATFLILSAIDLSGWFQYLYLPGLSSFGMAKSLLSFLQMPFFYFYVLSVCYSDFKLKPKHLLHAIPFVIANLVMTPRFYALDRDSKYALFENYNRIWEIIYIHISIELQFIIYIALVFVILNRYKKVYQQNFSEASSKAFDWLFQFTLASAIIHSVVLLKNILKYTDAEKTFDSVQLLVSVLALIIICWYVFKALKYPELFNGINSKTELVPVSITKEVSVNPKEIELLTSYMQTKKPYLNPSLSIRNLAEELKMNPRDLSILINQRLNQHFFDFVNEYRIKEAMDILSDSSKKEFTILEILYEVGFNSKSSFNTAFKKHTGKTPTEFRKDT